MAAGKNLTVNGDRLWDSLMDMAKIGPGIAGGNNRRTLTDEDAQGRSLFQRWCEAAGLTLGVDRMGTMFATRPGEVTRELLDGAATMISIKTARTGFTGSQRVLHLCEGLGTEVVMGNQIDGQLGTACTVVFGAAHRHTSARAGELSNYLDMSDDLLTEPLRISGGELRVPGGPGIGVDVDPDKLAHYRTDT